MMENGADEAAIAKRIARLSTDEIVSAVRATSARPWVKSAVALAASRPSERLGRILARFDVRIRSAGIGRAAREALSRFGATVDVTGSCPKRGPVLLVTNHPGAYDALATVASLERDDVALLALDRAFLRAMPALSEHLVFVTDDSVMGRARAVKSALRWLERGGVLVQFGAGAIEPDVRFDRPASVLGAWGAGTGHLAGRALRSCNAAIVPAFISGVHSPRAKKLLVTRWAEARGITTIAPLIQATAGSYRDVIVSLRIGPPIDQARLTSCETEQARTEHIRDAVAALAPQ